MLSLYSFPDESAYIMCAKLPVGADRSSGLATFPHLSISYLLKCYYRPTASLQLNNKRNTKYNITVT